MHFKFGPNPFCDVLSLRFFDYSSHSLWVSIFGSLILMICFLQKIYFFMFSYIQSGSFSPTPFQMRGVTLSHWLLNIFRLYNFPNFIFQKFYFHVPSTWKAREAFQLKAREDLLKNLYNSRCKFVPVEVSSIIPVRWSTDLLYFQFTYVHYSHGSLEHWMAERLLRRTVGR